MKVTQIRVAGQGAWPHLTLPSLSPELNVLYGPPRTGKSTVAHLAAHLLYGKADSPWRQQFAQMPPMAEGAIDVESPQGNFVLRRHRDGSQLGRLTVASASGAPVDNHTIRALLGGVAPALLAELFNVDFAEAPQAKTLLEGEFARQFTQAIALESADVATTSPVCEEHAPQILGQIDRRRVDELVRRRDEVVRQIESQMSERRRGSTAIAQEIATIESTLGKRRADAEELGTRLHAVESKLAEVAARLRYYSLETVVRPLAPGDAEARQATLDQLDAEASRCRQMLSDLQAREATVRRELAEVHPDGTADSIGSLAEQRATVGVLERLLDDLDAEVAGLARSHEPGRCIAADAHARMLPVVQLLRQQLYSMCGQVTEQERAVRRRQLRTEMRQLSRAQSDLSDQLEHLLDRRRTLVYEAQLSGRVTATLPQTPAAGHCQCEGHDNFVRHEDSLIAGRNVRGRHEDDLRTQRTDLEAQRQQLRQSGDALAQEMADLSARWERLQQDRTQTSERASLDELRGELERLEGEIARTLQSPVVPFAPIGVAGTRRRPWKASDALAQLTGGELTQIRLSREGRAATIVDRAGRLLVVDDLTPAQNDQLYVALVLALTSSLSTRGLDLPLVLDEPFLRQEPAGAAAMASVLAEYARQGRQMFVFTEDREALRHFESLGVAVHDIDALRRREVPVAPAVIVTPVATTSTVRVVRETIDAVRPFKPNVERVAAASDRAIEKSTYFLTADASIADFPVLGNDTLSVFSSLGIRTIEDLLAADAAEVARRLAHPAVSAEAVRLWQQHTSLMCFVPGVSLADAQVLAACEVTSPETLFNIDVRLLAEAVTRFLDTERGRRFATSRDRFSRDRIALLQKHARRQRDRWQLLSPRYAWVERTVESPKRRKKPEARPRRAQRPATTTPRIAHQTKRPQASPLRFFLDRRSSVADAPSIGAKTAERLTLVGVRTVADLLNANPESTAEELGVRHITATTLAQWQSQARLACRIPELRSAGAQILVACGFTEPEQIAAANLSELTRRVDAFCRTTEGQRLLRGGEAPSAARIAGWVRHAAQMRPLEAA
jgi:uncharacterized protein YunC (DUF1805 family)